MQSESNNLDPNAVFDRNINYKTIADKMMDENLK